MAARPGFFHQSRRFHRRPMLVATGVTATGEREILGLDVSHHLVDFYAPMLDALGSGRPPLVRARNLLGCRSQAAAAIADAHTTLVRLILGQPGASAWRKAAVWRSRDTHDALVNHWQAHGPDPVIERALRAGCLVMSAAARPVH